MTDLFGRLMIDIDGKNLSNDDKAILSSKHVGGLILFSRNFDSFDQRKHNHSCRSRGWKSATV